MIRLEPIVLRLPAEGDKSQDIFLVRVITADDVAYGEAVLSDRTVFREALAFFSDVIAYRHPLDFHLIWERCLEALEEERSEPYDEYMAVLSAVDIALWDLAGRTYHLPCWRMLGGRRAPALDCTVGGLQASDPELVQKAQRCRHQFGAAIEIVLSGDPEEDIAAIRRLRAALGDEVPLMADAGAGYPNLATALRVGQALEQAEAFWYENPLPLEEEHWEAYVSLRETLALGVAGGRYLFYGAPLQRAMTARAFDILVADLRRCGGLTAARSLAEMASLFGARFTLHSGESPLTQAAAANLAAAYGRVGPLQIVPPPAPLSDLFAPLLHVENGLLFLPDTPGLGCRFQEKAAENYLQELPDV